MQKTTDAAELSQLARRMRRTAIEMITEAKSGHPGGSLSVAEIIVTLFLDVLKHDPANPTWKDRDRFILSKGHCCPMLYAVMAECGYTPKDQLNTLRKLGSIYQGHPDVRFIPALEASTGSLGQGLSIGIGMALSARLDNSDARTYVVLGDGEIQEGQIWEAVMFAAHHKVDNLISTIDWNGQQIDGPTEKVIGLGNIREKFAAFGWATLEMNGNDMDDVIKVLAEAKALTGKGRPIAILMHTIMGKGVDFMENDHNWHGIAPNDDQLAKALAQLPTPLKDY